MTVVCVAVFLLALFAINKATPTSSYKCNSDTASGNDVNMTDLSEDATSLQYCMIDNCTIKRTDTGEELEIIHTTESLIVAVPTDGHTSEIVLKIDTNEISCITYTGEYKPNVIWAIARQLGLSLSHSIMNVYIVTVHLLFAELRTVFGKLLMFQNIVLFLIQVFSIMQYCSVGHSYIFFNHLCSRSCCGCIGLPSVVSDYSQHLLAVNNGFRIFLHLHFISHHADHVLQLQVQIGDAQKFVLILQLLCVWPVCAICINHHRVQLVFW